MKSWVKGIIMLTVVAMPAAEAMSSDDELCTKDPAINPPICIPKPTLPPQLPRPPLGIPPLPCGGKNSNCPGGGSNMIGPGGQKSWSKVFEQEAKGGKTRSEILYENEERKVEIIEKKI